MILLGLLLLIAAAGGAALIAFFARLEATGRGVTVVGAVWVLIVIDAASFHGFERPTGILHPAVGSLSFRLPELLIVMALVARLIARGMPERVQPSLLWWGAWAGWYASSGVIGLLAGHQPQLVFFEAKAIVYLVGGLILAAGVPASDYLRVLPRWLRRAAITALVMVLLDQAGVSITTPLPLFPLDNFGEIGGDAATIFATLGVVALALGSAQRGRSLRWLLVIAPLILAPFTTEQRAALLGLVLSLGIVVLAWLLPWGRRSLRVTPTELGLLAFGLLAFSLVPTVGSAAVQEPPPALPFTEELETALTSRAKVQSAESRANQWREASELIGEHRWMGWGLGKQYWYYEQGPDEMWESNITHSIVFDIGMRSGVIGLVLLAVALAASMLDGLRGLRHANPQVIALSLACLSCVVGLLAKGLVESIFEKYLLATLLGLLLGLIRSVSTAEPWLGDAPPTLLAERPAWN